MSATVPEETRCGQTGVRLVRPDPEEEVVRHRVALILAVSLLLGTLVVQPASSAVVIKAVSCTSCAAGYRWKPGTTSVVHGTKVTWKVVNGSHTVTSIGKNWSKNVSLSAGQATSFTFKTAGTYRFRCTIHSSYVVATKKCAGMCGKVVVS
jgi:plastocyanin